MRGKGGVSAPVRPAPDAFRAIAGECCRCLFTATLFTCGSAVTIQRTNSQSDHNGEKSRRLRAFLTRRCGRGAQNRLQGLDRVQTRPGNC